MIVDDYDQHGEATTLLNRMRTRGVLPDVMTYTALISGSKRTADCAHAESVFEEMLTYGVKPNCRTCTAMLKVRVFCLFVFVVSGPSVWTYAFSISDRLFFAAALAGGVVWCGSEVIVIYSTGAPAVPSC